MRRILRGDDEVGVSDVLGAVLLVGITVVMAAAFGAVLLSYDGPSDTQHTQLFVSVGPGADGDWGASDAELRIRHVGGEPLYQGAVTVTYSDLGGSHTVTPTFTGGRFDIGDSWTQVISASPGTNIEVSVVVQAGSSAAVISSGNVAAGGAGATLTYVNAITPTASKGTIDAGTENAAQSAGDSNAATILREGFVGGTPSSTTLSPTTPTTSGGSSTLVRFSDDQRSTLDNSGEWVQGATFTPPAGYAVSALSIGMEARATQFVSTVTHVSTLTGTATSGNSVSTVTTIPVTTGELYIASIANGVSTLRTVTGVSGPPGVTWSLVGTQANSAGNGRIEVWVGVGTPSLLGVVTASFSGTIDRAAIAVSRYSGADLTNPIQASLAGESPGNGGSTTVSLGTVAGTTNGIFYAALNGVTASGATGCSFTTPPNERADFDPGNNRVQLCTAGGPAAASNTLAATISSSADWQAIIFTIRPYATPLPTVVLSYSGCTGCTTSTTLTQALTTTDTQYAVSIINDKGTWSLSDLSNLAVRVTYPTDSTSDVDVDQVYLALTYTTTPTTFNTEAQVSFVNVPNLDTQVFQMRYKVTGDTFLLYALTGGVERQCPGVLNAASYAVFTCTLTAAEYASGSPVLRIKDATPAGTTQGIVNIEYARMSSV